MDKIMDAGRVIREFLADLHATARPSTLEEAMALRNSLLIEAEAAFTTLLDGLAPEEGPNHIRASEAVIEVVDADTGRLYRRRVDLSYTENENGIILAGEDMCGQPASIVYLSSSYLQKLVDISGQGPEEGHCHH